VRKLLIVEDEALVALGLQAAVEEAGHQVTGWATCSAEAVRLARKDAPDVALVDIQLARGDDGIELARRLQAEFGTEIIFVTGQGDPGTRERAAAVRCLAYVLKPFDPTELTRLLAP
jgi:CheY-like chemotaxis protein